MENLDRRYMIAGLIFLLIAVFAIGVKYADYKNHDRETKLVIKEDSNQAQSSGEKGKANDETIIQVYVCGEVNKPGVYRLPEGARLYEAIDMAEAKASAEVKFLDMARKLVDGESILVPGAGENNDSSITPPGSSAPATNARNPSPGASAGGKLNINRASVQELDEGLPGIGPSLAQRIVDYRSSNGDFKQIEDIKNVSGIGDKKFAAFKEIISVR
ncbi:MAG: helix-hairpin-helix domain-containing protein [Syntrophomonas sp.]